MRLLKTASEIRLLRHRSASLRDLPSARRLVPCSILRAVRNSSPTRLRGMVSARSTIGAQPQRDVCGLHRLPHHLHQVVAQGVEVSLVSQLGREGCKRLCCVVLAAVEAPVYERLDAAPQRIEESSDHQGGDHYGKLGGLLLLAGKRSEENLGRRYAPEVDCDQHGGERAIDQRAVDDYVYVVEAVPQDGETYRPG